MYCGVHQRTDSRRGCSGPPGSWGRGRAGRRPDRRKVRSFVAPSGALRRPRASLHGPVHLRTKWLSAGRCAFWLRQRQPTPRAAHDRGALRRAGSDRGRARTPAIRRSPRLTVGPGLRLHAVGATGRNCGNVSSSSISTKQASTRMPTTISSVFVFDQVAHDEGSLIEFDHDDVVGNLGLECGEDRWVADRVRVHRSGTGAQRPLEHVRLAIRAAGPWKVSVQATCGARWTRSSPRRANSQNSAPSPPAAGLGKSSRTPHLSFLRGYAITD